MVKTIQEAKMLIEQQPISDLITVAEDGALADRTMFTPRVDDDFTVYFGTYRDSEKCGQINANASVIVVWPAENGYLSLKGKATITDDRSIREKAWHPAFSSHFAGGSADPTFVVIRIDPLKLYYYQFGTVEAQMIELGNS